MSSYQQSCITQLSLRETCQFNFTFLPCKYYYDDVNDRHGYHCPCFFSPGCLQFALGWQKAVLTFSSITAFHYISGSVFSILLLLALSSFLEDVHHPAGLHQLSKSLTLSPELQLSSFATSFVGREKKKKPHNRRMLGLLVTSVLFMFCTQPS